MVDLSNFTSNNVAKHCLKNNVASKFRCMVARKEALA